jgi:hypothetical protein
VQNQFSQPMFVLMIVLVISPVLLSQGTPRTAGTETKLPNPRDLSGVWWVDDPGPEKLLARGRNRDVSKCETCHVPEHTEAEPPLTPWAKEHLIIANDTYYATAGKPTDSGDSHPRMASRHDCEPVSPPSQFWYTQLSPFEFVVTPDRIFQFFENQSEWRAIWMNRNHPKELEPTYMGDSVGKWDGNTLVIDTIGFNGKDLVEPVGVNHLMSDAFHLVERWRRVDANRLELDVTYYDPKAWGDKSWGGLKKEFVLQANSQLMEGYCEGDAVP